MEEQEHPKEKAEQLYSNFADTLPDAVEISHQTVKDCALIAVDEIMIALTEFPYGVQNLYHQDYWKEVKEEIEKL